MPLVIRVILAIVLTVTATGAQAENPANLPIIGQVYFGDGASAKPYEEAFREGMREHGYVDGRNVLILARYASGDPNQLSAYLAELVARPVTVLVVTSKALAPAIRATQSIPIVCPAMANPVREGIAASFSHPGGNVTGGYGLGTETDAKRLELIRELVPSLKHLGIVFDADEVGLTTDAEALRDKASSVGVSARMIGIRRVADLQAVLGTAEGRRLQALIVFNSPLVVMHREQIIRLAETRPVISEGRDLSQAGALITYSADYISMFKRSAAYVDRILRGQKPGDIPIEQPSKFELIVNTKAAKALRIKVPESIMLRADEVVR